MPRQGQQERIAHELSADAAPSHITVTTGITDGHGGSVSSRSGKPRCGRWPGCPVPPYPSCSPAPIPTRPWTVRDSRPPGHHPPRPPLGRRPVNDLRGADRVERSTRGHNPGDPAHCNPRPGVASGMTSQLLSRRDDTIRTTRRKRLLRGATLPIQSAWRSVGTETTSIVLRGSVQLSSMLAAANPPFPRWLVRRPGLEWGL